MPEETADPELARVAAQLAGVEAERDRLQAELDTVSNRALDRWLSVNEYESAAVASLQQTLSWRVTKPLRAVRELQLRRATSSGARE